MLFSTVLTALASAASVTAQYKGFNYGAQGMAQGDFETRFNDAKNLVGASGFTSARLYTMIQDGTVNTPTSAIQAAIDTGTTLLLGLWASEDQNAFNNELAALANGISQYGTAFTDLIVGISVGSEDLYRITPTGIANNAGYGVGPDVITQYIGEVRNVIANTAAAGKPVGHVDTWTAWVNSSNNAVIAACDFLGMDAYPYYQTTMQNDIGSAKNLFFDALSQTQAASQGKPVWVTETGWPLAGPQENQAVASVDNSKTYWDEVGCALFGQTNTWWYTLYDGTPSPTFGVVGTNLGNTPVFDLTC